MKVVRHLIKFFKIPYEERVLLLYALSLNIYYTTIVHTLPLKRYLPIFNSDKYFSESLISENIKHEYFALVKKTIKRISFTIPKTSNCLIKALIFKKSLEKRKIGSEIEIEIFKGKTTGNFLMHAYVSYKSKPIFLFRNEKDYIIMKLYGSTKAL